MQFLVLIGIVFVVFIIFVVGFAERYNDIRKEKEFVAIRDIGLKVHAEVSIAQSVEDGFIRSFTLAETSSGYNYSLSLVSNILTVVGENHEYSVVLAPFVGTVKKGLNTISRSGGVVWLN